jgi:hypothetical protein
LPLAFTFPFALLPQPRQQPWLFRQRISILEEMEPAAGLNADQGRHQQWTLLLPQPLRHFQQMLA